MTSDVSATPRRLRPHHHAAALLCAGLVVLGVRWWRVAQHEEPMTLAAAPAGDARDAGTDANPQADGASASEGVTESETPRNELREKLLGSWEDDFYGRRLFTFAEDGTATMTLELDPVSRMLYGPKLTFYIAWSLQDDVLTMSMTGGEPEGTATTLAKLFGEKSEQRIEQLAGDELQLRSLDSQKLYTHRRVAK